MEEEEKKLTRRGFLGTTLRIGAGMAAYPVLRSVLKRSNSPYQAFAGEEGSAPSNKKLSIRLASCFPATHILTEACTKFKELLEKTTGGRIEVDVQPAVASEEEVGVWCSEGKVEMQATGGEPLENYANQYFFINAPYVMMDFEHFMRVWSGPLGDQARELVEKNGNMMYVGIVYRGLRQMTSNKPIHTPADVAGLKLRLPGVPSWIAVWKEIGADPQSIPLTELYDCLSDGRAEASEGDLPQIHSFELYKVQNYLTITNHLVQTGGILINKPFFDGLSKADQDLIMKTSKEAIEWANNKIKTGEADILEDLKKKGMQVIIPDAEAFRKKGKPAVEKLFRDNWPVTTWEEVLKQ